MNTPTSLDPDSPDFGVINGVNQITTVVAGVDVRQQYSPKVKNSYWIGQFYTSPEGVVDYDNYFLFDNLDTDWSASKASNPLWNDITFQDVRNADRFYENATDKQKYNIDWVRGLALQYGYWGLFCIDEPDWYCAIIYAFLEELDIGYDSAAIDINADINIVNTFEPAKLNDQLEALAGQHQKVSSLLLK